MIMFGISSDMFWGALIGAAWASLAWELYLYHIVDKYKRTLNSAMVLADDALYNLTIRDKEDEEWL